MKRNTIYSTHIGAASVLLIFLVLSLISFAALALVNARADYVLSQKMNERSIAYYGACHEANGFIAENEPRFRNSSHTDSIGNDEDVNKSIPLSDFQTLDVTIRPFIEDNKVSYSIAKWKVETHTDEVILDESLPVMK